MINHIANDFNEVLKYKETQPFVKKDDVECLNPDKIDNREFWLQLHDKFKYRPFCGPIQHEPSATDIVVWNSLLHIQTGLMNRLLCSPIYLQNEPYKVLDIGAGLCPILKIIKSYALPLKWYGIDLIRHVEIDDYVECDGSTIPDCLPAEFDFIVSGNVFQHLSEVQIKSYFKQSYDRLRPKGFFTVGFHALSPSRPPNSNSYDGEYYLYNFGQLTKLHRYGTVVDWLKKVGFTIIQTSVRNDEYTVFDCQK